RAGGNTRFVYALLDNVLLGQIGAGLRQLRGLGFLGIRVADDYQLGRGIVLQTQSDVIAHALAGIVKPRCASLVVAAIAGLGCLWWRWRLLHVNRGIRIRGSTLAVADRALHGVT